MKAGPLPINAENSGMCDSCRTTVVLMAPVNVLSLDVEPGEHLAITGANGSVNSTVKALLTQTVSLLRGERADQAVLDLAELAVARRGEVVAHVEAAAALSDAQRTRLTSVLTRIYGHPVSVQLHVDPSLLGGLTITVGDEVIDGSISSRLAAASNRLPD